MQLKRVVVTGIGCLTPIGNSTQEYFDALVEGVSGAGLITRFDTTNFKTKFACEVKNFDIGKFLDRKESRKLDLYAQFAIASTEEAIADSKINLETANMDRIGVIWGSGIGGIETFQNEVSPYATGNKVPRFNPFFIPKMISNIAAGHISMRYGFRGPSYTTTSACASATHAIIDAFNYIRMGKADVFVTGGSEAAICEVGIGGFNAMQALSTNNDNYMTASRPFDDTRDGFVMGEGSVTLVVEELEHALSRGAEIYAEIIGGGMSSDAHHLTAPHPEGTGAISTMRNALEDAGINPEDIDYVNVHGTSTPLGDVAETMAVAKLFGEHAYKLSISSTKSMTGHLLGAAGAAEAVACILAINRNIVPPTINNTSRDPKIDPKLNLTLNVAEKRDVKIALSNTFGFGGHNASIIVKEFTK
jgi:3-oxoacyl-[acyl-carrier-protein] synthase II